MTTERQQRKALGLRWRWGRAALRGAFAGVALVWALAGSTASAQVVANRLTGLALEGYDPVAYFTASRPILGQPALESAYGGVVWRFVNEGNRAAFRDDPAVYTPRFGGHDPVEAARGKVVPGHPEIWRVRGGRLYLFYEEANRRRFDANPGPIAAEAEKRWSDMARRMVN